MAAAELLLPIPEPLAEPLVLAEPPLFVPLAPVFDDMPLVPLPLVPPELPPLMADEPLPLVPLVLLPLMPEEPEPEEAVFSFGWPVA